ncbi:NfeD family protein [Clostridium sp. cel8]|jgi:membrane protein implicated in regulation of membrane protease activity|uniref:NfeD family protein n=2 Tax=unclassified Clostridium TaxID=2614128 RepID=UPI001FABE8C2|nr:NfeD family protein [Clostridium sp. cel8]
MASRFGVKEVSIMFSFIFWILIGVAALVVDILTSAFLFVWFTIGAICAIIANSLGYSQIVQFTVFLVVSILLIAICYPIIRKNMKKGVHPTALREKTYIGKKLIVDEEMEKNNAVKLDGVLWNIENNDIILKKGDIIKIVGMKGTKVLIKKGDDVK